MHLPIHTRFNQYVAQRGPEFQTDAQNIISLNIHTLQLGYLLSDWLFSKYAECMENVQCTPEYCAHTAWGAIGKWHVCDRHIVWSIFAVGKVVYIL